MFKKFTLFLFIFLICLTSLSIGQTGAFGSGGGKGYFILDGDTIKVRSPYNSYPLYFEDVTIATLVHSVDTLKETLLLRPETQGSAINPFTVDGRKTTGYLGKFSNDVVGADSVLIIDSAGRLGIKGNTNSSYALYLNSGDAYFPSKIGVGTGASALQYAVDVVGDVRATSSVRLGGVAGGASNTTINASDNYMSFYNSTTGFRYQGYISSAVRNLMYLIGNTGNLQLGDGSVWDGQSPDFIIYNDADSDGSQTTAEALTISLAANATPTSATWDFTSTQSNGYRFDKKIGINSSTFSTSNGALAIGGNITIDDGYFIRFGSDMYVQDSGTWLTLQATDGVRLSATNATQATNALFHNFSGGTFTGTNLEQTYLNIAPTINQSGTASYIGLKLNVTRTAVGSGNTRLFSFEVGDADRIYGEDDGDFYAIGTLKAGSSGIQITDATGNLDGTKVANADLGDIGVSSGVWSVEDDSHNHTTASGKFAVSDSLRVEKTALIKGQLSLSSRLVWQDSLIMQREVNELDSAEVILVASGVCGWGEMMAGDNQEWAQFRFSASGAVTLIANTANVANSNDQAEKICIYDVGSGIAIKNNLAGAEKQIAVNINYYTP